MNIVSFVFKITLIQGLNRQIRRMCEYFDYDVTKLERTRIMNISLKGLPLGEWRELTDAEMTGILKMIKNSSSTEEASKTKSIKLPNSPNRKNTVTNSSATAKPYKKTGNIIGKPKNNSNKKSPVKKR